ncbi:acyl-CoA carboxylase subunit epsilon [Microbacterium radiodurans]|uniref:Acyl-CoA carboxylase subunit epsilon n=1 Tax=Microbacterium radiodurans TaxID=661398 RepID=A0A5J5IQU9_9MICO|nr:acyl-CoA carboxylase subunit epsilon [Microbacterium radiodurans]KAA9085070.1 acyl-CoA carboxylase subunit epsilon [Microbacterium radiodurans]
MSGAAASDPAAGAAGEPLRIDVRRGDPTPEELAAVIAVVSESYAQENADAVAADPPMESAWRRSARALRAPLKRGYGWGRFTG